MLYLFLILLCGLPFSCFLFRDFDIWHAQGFWFQAVLFIIFIYSFFDNKTKKELPNLPLAGLSLWVGLITFYTCYMTMAISTIKYSGGGAYNNTNFFPFFNYLCFFFFYK